ncbi:MAG: hypothetical protein IJQ31_16310 [Thermoguttaceae bacterium]|nr:hypothetical protein [Thermoguttaceae bacterium]
MNENPNQNLKIDEAETLERELAAAPEWAGFGQVLAAAHEAVYSEPERPEPCKIPAKPRHLAKYWPVLSVAALVLLALTIGLFYGNGQLGNRSAIDEYDPELDWEEGEMDLELFHEQLERVALDDSSVELEYAVLFDSLSEWDEESSEEEIF